MAENPSGRLPISAGKSAYYGETELLKQRQRAVPMGQPPTDVNARRSIAAKNVEAATGPARPGSMPPLTRRTDRPSEPLTAGAAFGAGPGPMQAGIMPVSPQSIVVDELRSLGMMFPDSGILDLLDKYGNT